MPEPAIRTVAVFNASDDTVEMLKALLSSRGYRALSERVDHVKSGELNFVEFLSTHRPHALIWDIAPPYDRNWNFVQLLRSINPLQGCGLVLTTTNKRHVDSLAGHDTGAFEIVGKPYDLEAIVEAVENSLERRPVAGPRALEHERT
jgi:CheY-like chemotaxis protein